MTVAAVLEVAPRVVTGEAELRALVAEASAAERLAVDLEASGMFTYRARLCTVQLAWGQHIVVVDAIRAPVGMLAPVLGAGGPVKIVHDVAFDARVLADAGIELGRVHDTAIAARMLGRTATGLASLAKAELGVSLAKAMQHNDWRIRPLDEAMLGYLAADVIHLGPLERKLWGEVTEQGILAEVLEETSYRIDSAIAAAREPEREPPYLRIKGLDRLNDRERAALRLLAELREQEAERRDVPPYRVAPSDALVAMARARPKSRAEIARFRGVDTSGEAAGFIDAVAVGMGVAPDGLPAEERARFERPRPALETVKLRREREARLLAWRKAEAKRRGVDEQVVLPGHCLKDAAELQSACPDELARVPGIGAFRVARDGQAMVLALRGDGWSPALPEPGRNLRSHE
jgi:ribonuclease D